MVYFKGDIMNENLFMMCCIVCGVCGAFIVYFNRFTVDQLLHY